MIMNEFLFFCVFTSLAITGIHVVFMQDKLMGLLIGNYLRKHVAEWLLKPLFNCLVCMGGLWTVVVRLVMYKHFDIKVNILCILCVIGLNALILQVINKMYE